MVNGYNPSPPVLGPSAERVYGSEPPQPISSHLRELLGVLMAHDDERYQSDRQPLALAASVASGTQVFERMLSFQAKSITIDNPSGYTLYEPSLFQLIPPNVYDFPIRIDSAIQKIALIVAGGSQSTAVTGYVRISEARILPIPLLSTSPSSGGSGVPVALSPSSFTDASSTITLGGTAQNVFGSVPVNGYEISNPDASNDLWISDASTAVVNGTGSIRIPANGWTYVTPITGKPTRDVSIIAAVTGTKFTARRW